MKSTLPERGLFSRAALLLGTRTLILISFLGVTTSYGQTRAPAVPDPGQRVVLITGSTGGLGREVAYRVAATGAHVIVHGRNVDRGNEVVEKITEEGTGSARFFRTDLADLNAVRDFAETIRNTYDRLDVLINNAGIVTTSSGAREESVDGYELVFAVNYLAGYLLTHELLPLLIQSAPSRVINVSSISQTTIDFDDPMLERGYDNIRAYSQSKLAQVMFTLDLAAELEGTGVLAVSLHPASMMDTDMVVEDLGAQPRSSVQEGTDAVMHLVTGSDLVNGQYYNGLTPGRARDQAYDEAARDQLRELSEKLIAESVH